MKISNTRFLYLVLGLALVVYVITAYHSEGFYHADEHYQIIEFAGTKLGTHTPSELAWEYDARIRPTLQPTICYILLKAFNTIGVGSPYILAFLLRLITALFALVVSFLFVKSNEDKLESDASKKLFYFLSFFLWFIPFIAVRFSSETWSGLFFILSLVLLSHKNKRLNTPLVIGLVLGISFLFRFQIAFAVIPVYIWLFFIRKESILYLLKLSFGVFISIGFGFLIDSWFYGELVFTPWNYFDYNILQDVASNFGTSPWDFYIESLFFLTLKPIAFVIFASFGILLIKKTSNLYIWAFIFFIGLHSVIPHKEARFIFPVLFLLPIIIGLAFDQLKPILDRSRITRIITSVLLFILFVINGVGSLAIMFKPADNGIVSMAHYISVHYQDDEINFIHGWWANPHNPWHGVPIKFYHNKNIDPEHIESLCELNDSVLNPKKKNILVIRRIELSLNRCNDFIEANHFVLKHQSTPQWIESFFIFYRGIKPENTLLLYELE